VAWNAAAAITSIAALTSPAIVIAMMMSTIA
jgi:hypothetical protein